MTTHPGLAGILPDLLWCAEDKLDKWQIAFLTRYRVRRIGSHPGMCSRRGFGLQRYGKKLSVQGWSRDLGESGLGAFVAEALILGESVTLEIPLPDCDKQVIPAKVVRARGTEYGFQFMALSAEQRRQIRATLKERPAIPRHGAGQ